MAYPQGINRCEILNRVCCKDSAVSRGHMYYWWNTWSTVSQNCEKVLRTDGCNSTLGAAYIEYCETHHEKRFHTRLIDCNRTILQKWHIQMLVTEQHIFQAVSRSLSCFPLQPHVVRSCNNLRIVAGCSRALPGFLLPQSLPPSYK